ncbi:hypothetical protein ACFY9S_40060 [Streptomyces sp. NPDC012474]|uniref:hypothetical protein n=1 Tax=Streptomyces sp. NPDC012474 TaxID=3364836 RepID=UPI0036E4B18F
MTEHEITHTTPASAAAEQAARGRRPGRSASGRHGPALRERVIGLDADGQALAYCPGGLVLDVDTRPDYAAVSG